MSLNRDLPQNEFQTLSLKTEKIHNNFSSQNIVISSQNNVRKYCKIGHEQV